MNHSLLTLFTPPEDYIGDFGMLCGFTASRDVLSRIARAFSGDGSRPHLAAFVHPTATAVTDIAGVTWMHFRRRPFRLLHAKVALLGFRKRDLYCIRLAVSTGNWTAEPLTTSIDMYWCGELALDTDEPQLVADIRAADSLFLWLREQADDTLLHQRFDGALPDSAFREAIDALPKSYVKSRFIDTRNATMKSQVLERLAGSNRGHLVIGSGFYEAAGGNEKEVLIEALHADLVGAKRLAQDAQLDLVLNPESCQALHARAGDLVESGWSLRRPDSFYPEHSSARLHAKFLFLAKNAGLREIGPAQIYIGSANFSRMGFESVTPGGNLEAGIVIKPDRTLSWRRNALNAIWHHIPGDFDVVIDVAALAAGAAFELPPAPPAPPPVTFLEWAEGRLCVSVSVTEVIVIVGYDGELLELPCDWPAPPPAFVTLHPDGWKVPVRADGALVVPRNRIPSLADILADIGHFPASGTTDGEEHEESENDDTGGADDGSRSRGDPERAYPIRQMMRLIVRLAERQKELDPRDWQRWCRELQQDLPGLAVTETRMIEPFIDACVNPLVALTDPAFLPDSVDVALISKAIERIGEHWGLSSAQNLWRQTS
jgi:hypothetical protein